MRDVLHVEPARGDVGRDQQVGSVRAELLHHAVALLLREAAVQRLGTVSARVQRLGDLIHLCARAAEHDGGLRLLHVEDAAERGHLMCARDDVRHLADLRRLSRLEHLAVDPDNQWVPQVLLGDRGDARRQRRREQRDLFLCRCGRENRLEVLGESHVEHLIGLVEHDDSHRTEMNRLAADVIERATRRRDHDIHAALERADLRFHRRTAVDRQCDRADPLAVPMDGLGHLHRELACGNKHECGGALTGWCVRIQPVQQRQRERGGLAGACRGLRHHVAAREQGRDGGKLDGRRLLVAQCGEGREDSLVECESAEVG